MVKYADSAALWPKWFLFYINYRSSLYNVYVKSNLKQQFSTRTNIILLGGDMKKMVACSNFSPTKQKAICNYKETLLPLFEVVLMHRNVTIVVLVCFVCLHII